MKADWIDIPNGEWKATSIGGKHYSDKILSNTKGMKGTLYSVKVLISEFHNGAIHLKDNPQRRGELDILEKLFAGFSSGELYPGQENNIEDYLNRNTSGRINPFWEEFFTIPEDYVLLRGIWMWGQQESLSRKGSSAVSHATILTNPPFQNPLTMRLKKEEPEFKTLYVTESGLRFRTEPNQNCSILYNLMKGDELKYSGKKVSMPDHVWLKCEFRGEFGWVASGYVTDQFISSYSEDYKIPQVLMQICPPNLDVKMVAAIALIESGARTKDLNGGKLVSRFEQHIYDRTNIPDEDQRRAYSTSFGVGQLMGWNCRKFGFKNPVNFVKWLENSPKNEWQSLITFIESNPALENAVNEKDWITIARNYNGAGFAKNRYDEKLEQAYDRVHLDTSIPVKIDTVDKIKGFNLKKVTQVNPDDGKIKSVVKHGTREAVQWARFVPVIAVALLATNPEILARYARVAYAL